MEPFQIGPEEEALIAILQNKYRRGWLLRKVPKSICERVADHSRKVSKASWLYAPHSTANRFKARYMGLIHDIGECIVPDYTPQDNISSERKYAQEQAAVLRITSNLRNGTQMYEIWQEYHESKTPEAMLTHQLDKLDAAIQAISYQAMDYKVEEFFASTRTHLLDPFLILVFDKLLDRRPLKDPYPSYFAMLKEGKCK